MTTSTTTKHTAEPWGVENDIYCARRIYACGDGSRIVDVCGDSEEAGDMANADRIVACVNACTGMEDPANGIEKARTLLRLLSSKQDGVGHQAAEALRALGG